MSEISRSTMKIWINCFKPFIVTSTIFFMFSVQSRQNILFVVSMKNHDFFEQMHKVIYLLFFYTCLWLRYTRNVPGIVYVYILIFWENTLKIKKWIWYSFLFHQKYFIVQLILKRPLWNISIFVIMQLFGNTLLI